MQSNALERSVGRILNSFLKRFNHNLETTFSTNFFPEAAVTFQKVLVLNTVF